MFRFRSGRRPHILVVDDEPDMCWTLENILRPAGYAVTTTTSGAEAIEKAQEGFFDLALLDIRLPDMEGIELVAPLKEMHPDMVVIMLTAYASLETAVQALNGGASAYITKPLNVDEVLATVRGALEKQRLVMEKRQVEEALRESEARYRLLAENANDAIYMLDPDLRITDVNPFTEQATGYSQDELIGRSLPELGLLAPASLGLALEDAARVLAGERISGAVYEFITKGGRHLFGEVSGAPIYQEGQVVGVLAIARDITERMRAEEALRESEERYRSTLDSMLEGCQIIGSDLRYLYVNDAVARHGRRAKEELLGHAMMEMYPGIEDTEMFSTLRRCMERRTSHHMENEFTFPDGSKGWFDLSIQPVPEGIFILSVDITDRKRAEEEIQRHLERIEALREIDKAITSTLNLPEVLDIILEELDRVIPYHSAGIFLLSDGTARLTAGRGFPDLERALQVAFPVKEDPLTRELLQGEHPLVLADAQADERFLARGGTEYARSWIGVPLIAKGGTVGFLTIDHREPGVYDEESEEMAQAFAGQVAIAIENARLYEEAQRELAEREQAEEELQRTLEKLREALGGIIQTVALTVETKDPYTAGHQRHVGNLARTIANEMGLPQEQIDGIRMAGLIHDLGKIAIPAEILSTPIRLNGFQWGIIKGHPKVGYDILKKIEFPWPVAQIVLQHHERMDGSGYPQGLSGEEIILEARILAVADVVEAMASFRPYRPALGIDKALEEISQNRGVLYDPETVGVCLRLFTEKGFEFE